MNSDEGRIHNDKINEVNTNSRKNYLPKWVVSSMVLKQLKRQEIEAKLTGLSLRLIALQTDSKNASLTRHFIKLRSST